MSGAWARGRLAPLDSHRTSFMMNRGWGDPHRKRWLRRGLRERVLLLRKPLLGGGLRTRAARSARWVRDCWAVGKCKSTLLSEDTPNHAVSPGYREIRILQGPAITSQRALSGDSDRQGRTRAGGRPHFSLQHRLSSTQWDSQVRARLAGSCTVAHPAAHSSRGAASRDLRALRRRLRQAEAQDYAEMLYDRPGDASVGRIFRRRAAAQLRNRAHLRQLCAQIHNCVRSEVRIAGAELTDFDVSVLGYFLSTGMLESVRYERRLVRAGI